MELNFEEIPGTGPPQFENNYWDNKPDHSAQKKARFSYDDILNSLNLVVQNGVLKQIQVKPTQGQGQSQGQRQGQNQGQLQQQPMAQKSVTFDPQVKNSYIYNKYFKDYQEHQQGVDEEPPRPLTKEEYRQMMIQDYINRQQAQIRLSQIKSRKLLFNTQHINIAPNQMPRDMNKLFKPFTR